MGERTPSPLEGDQSAVVGLSADRSVSAEKEAALLGADRILELARADERGAAAARVRYRRDGIPSLGSDEQIGPLLQTEERVVAVRRPVTLDRREPPSRHALSSGLGGDLYVTSRRLVLVGRRTVTFELADIEDVVLSGERLLLIMREGAGVRLDAARPRLLRVQIAAARTALPGGPERRTQSRSP